MYKYYLFISYSRRDSRAAAYLQRQLEHFRVPVKLVAKENLPEGQKYLRPVFRDRRDLKNTEESFTSDIKVALEQSRYLLVLCSPNSAESKWVDAEIKHFLKTHGGDYSKIVPVILSGRPGTGGAEECLPKKLRLEKITSRNLPSMIPDDGESEKNGWENGVVQSLSYMLKIEREKIKASVDRERLRQTRIYAVIGVCAAVVFAFMAMWAVHEKQAAERNRLEAERNRLEAEQNLERAIAGETRAKENADRAIASEKKEKEQAEIAMKSLDFLEDMFSGNNEENAGNRRVKDVLVTKISEIERITPDVLRAAISEVVGGLLVKNSVYPPAKELLEYAVQYYEKEGDLSRLKNAINLLGIYYSFTGDFEQAGKYYLQALGGGEDVVIYINLSDNALRAGKYEDAEAFANKAVEMSRKEYGENDFNTLNSMLQLGKVYLGRDELEKLETLLQKVENTLVDSGQLNTNAYLTLCNQFGNLYMKLEKYDKSLEYYQKALKVTIEFWGESSENTAAIYNNIGHIYTIKKDNLRAIESLEKALESIKSVQPDGSALEATICNNIGVFSLDLKNYSKALELFNRSLELRSRICGEKHPDTGETLMNLAYYFDLSGDFEKAIDYDNRALKAYKGSSGDNTARIAIIYNNLGEIYRKKSDNVIAIRQYEEAMAIWERILGAGRMNESLATIHNNLALAYFALGEREEALKHIAIAVAFIQKHLPPGHEQRRLFMQNKAMIENAADSVNGDKPYVDEQDKINQEFEIAKSYFSKASEDPENSQKWFDEAEKTYKQISEYYIRAQKADTPEIALVYNQLGSIMMRRKRMSEAVQWFCKSLSINERLYGENHVETIVNYNNLFNACMNAGEYLEALQWGGKYINASLSRNRKDRDLAVIYHNMAFCHGKLHNDDEEEKYYQKALQTHLSLEQKDLSEISTVYVNLGVVYSARGDYEKSLEYYRKGIEIRENLKDFPKETLALDYNNMALVIGKLGDKEGEIKYIKKALDINLAVKGEEDLEVATNYMNISLCFKDMKKYREAAEMAEKALEIMKAKLGEEHEKVFLGYNQLGILYHSLGDDRRSLEYHERALDTALKILGEEHDDTGTCYGNIADVQLNLKNYRVAKEAAEKSLAIERLLHGEDRSLVLSRYYVLGRIHEEGNVFGDSIFYFKKCASLALPRQDVTDEKKLEYVIKTNTSYRQLSQSQKQEEYKNVKELFDGYLEAYPKEKSRNMRSSLIYECVRFYIASGEIEEAREAYRAGLSLYNANEPGDQSGISMAHFIMADACKGNGLYQESISYYQLALKTDLARSDVSWDDVRFEYLELADSYYEIGKYQEAYEHFEKALGIIKDKQLKDDSVDDYKTIMKKCRAFLEGRRIVFRISKLMPGENGEKAGMMVDDVFLSMEGWSVRQKPNLPHESSGIFKAAIDAIIGKEKDFAVARKVNGALQPMMIHCPKGAVGVQWAFDYVTSAEYDEYVRLLDKMAPPLQEK